MIGKRSEGINEFVVNGMGRERKGMGVDFVIYPRSPNARDRWAPSFLIRGNSDTTPRSYKMCRLVFAVGACISSGIRAPLRERHSCTVRKRADNPRSYAHQNRRLASGRKGIWSPVPFRDCRVIRHRSCRRNHKQTAYRRCHLSRRSPYRTAMRSDGVCTSRSNNR